MVMTDRDLLELAARAAGHEISARCMDGVTLALSERKPDGTSIWNPLADNGDALRLAVKLELIVGCYAGSIIVDGKGVTAEEHDLSDRNAATRRAIVRAAAEIGKGMFTQEEFIKMFPGRFDDETVAAAEMGKQIGAG